MVVPAAPTLANINTYIKYHEALMNSDFAIPDSGFMVLTIRIIKNVKIKKLSGYAFLEKFLNERVFKTGKYIFLVDPSKEDSFAS